MNNIKITDSHGTYRTYGMITPNQGWLFRYWDNPRNLGYSHGPGDLFANPWFSYKDSGQNMSIRISRIPNPATLPVFADTLIYQGEEKGYGHFIMSSTIVEDATNSLSHFSRCNFALGDGHVEPLNPQQVRERWLKNTGTWSFVVNEGNLIKIDYNGNITKI